MHRGPHRPAGQGFASSPRRARTKLCGGPPGVGVKELETALGWNRERRRRAPIAAQGNALGTDRYEDIREPCRGGPIRVPPPTIGPPLQGSISIFPRYPGRCPGLGLGRASGALDSRSGSQVNVLGHEKTPDQRFETRSSQLTARSSQHAARSSQFTAHSSQFTAHSSQLTARSSQLTAHSSQLTAHSSQFTAHSSQFTARSSQLAARSSQLTAHSSQFTAHSSQLAARSSQLTVHSSQFTAHSSQFTVHSSQLTAHSSQLTAHSSQLAARSSQLAAHSLQLATRLHAFCPNAPGPLSKHQSHRRRTPSTRPEAQNVTIARRSATAA